MVRDSDTHWTKLGMGLVRVLGEDSLLETSGVRIVGESSDGLEAVH